MSEDGATMGGVERSKSGLAYRGFGTANPPPGRPTVVLLHGIPGCGAAWFRVAEQLSDRAEVIVVDLLGFGASERPTGLDDLHAAGQARALSELIDELGLERVVVAGHDFGGPVALALHARRPGVIAGLALLATNAFTDTPIPFPLSTVTWPFVGGALSTLLFSGPSLAMMLRNGVGRPRVTLPASTHLGDRAQREAIRTIFFGSLTDLERLYRPIEDELGKVTVPVTVGWGDRDPFFGVEQGRRTAEALSTSLKLYPGAGHFLPEERPDEVAADLARLVAAT